MNLVETIKKKSLKNKLLLIFYPFYGASFLLFQKIDFESTYHLMHLKIDELVPFIPSFLIFYVSWHALLYLYAAYSFITDDNTFNRMTVTLGLCYAISIICYVVYPTCQDLRPDLTLDDRFFSSLVSLIYAADTPCNVNPSMHVSFTSVIITNIINSNIKVKWLKQIAFPALGILICLSTIFIKQHSIIDVIFGFIVALLAMDIERLVRKVKSRA